MKKKDKFAVLVSGITKREFFAAMALQGYISSPHNLVDEDGNIVPRTQEFYALGAVGAADALIKELEREGE